jgi:hypothetical protein
VKCILDSSRAETPWKRRIFAAALLVPCWFSRYHAADTASGARKSAVSACIMNKVRRASRAVSENAIVDRE